MVFIPKPYKNHIFKFFRIVRNLMTKTLIEISRQVWGKVKDFATVEDISVNLAVEQLLKKALVESGYLLGRGPARAVN